MMTKTVERDQDITPAALEERKFELYDDARNRYL